ncbi:MAG: thioredoxin fold domain-containing protein [Planctomycetaceae bacterium]|nr:thioredoxin fold domain-containing protein [Planctomycetaceae bacterium]MCP4464797.1 thioredoxin fold domain-containing protein [Planctomycetaceae bacterium]MDG1807476.1 thioredoxin domain-containing protein [Pirellulaceae bacterium]MDG2105501.1 thioredoxin domain-containing protein [Pirellulaceae bacterium]
MENKLKLVCPDCLSVNRLPRERLHDGPNCGKCQADLLPGSPIELTSENFAIFIEKTGLPVVVDFWASWCPPCRAMEPAFKEAASLLSPLVILAKLSTEDSADAAQPFNIQGIPCLIGFQNNAEVGRQAGALPADQIVSWVNSLPWT